VLTHPKNKLMGNTQKKKRTRKRETERERERERDVERDIERDDHASTARAASTLKYVAIGTGVVIIILIRPPQRARKATAEMI